MTAPLSSTAARTDDSTGATATVAMMTGAHAPPSSVVQPAAEPEFAGEPAPDAAPDDTSAVSPETAAADPSPGSSTTAAPATPSSNALYPDIRVSELMVPAPHGSIRCQVFTPPDAEDCAMLLYIHGGGFTSGASEDTADLTGRLAFENGLVVVSVNYRLAPQHPFPAGLDDCVKVLDWMRRNAGELGGDSRLIAVAGDSTGGNLAAALPLRAREEKVEPPQAVVLLCPLTDFRFELYDVIATLAPQEAEAVTRVINALRTAYAPAPHLWSHPHVSPACANVHDYPPTLIVADQADPLIDDNRAFAHKLIGATRQVQLVVLDGHSQNALLSDPERAFAAIARFLGRAMAPL
jgi:acetyl esterase